MLAPDVAGAWLGGHLEVVTLGVPARARGAGIGPGLGAGTVIMAIRLAEG